MTKVKMEIVVEVDKCPVCGSPNRFAGAVAKEEVEKGLFGEDWKFGLVEPRGRVSDPRRVVIAESKAPVISALLDICLGYPDTPCGCVYAVRLLRGEAPAQEEVEKPAPGHN